MIPDDITTMPTLVKPANNSTGVTDLNAPKVTYPTLKLTLYFKSAKLKLLIAIGVLLPLSSQAALPESVQTALARAAIDSQDISIVVTPIGDKYNSRLPSVVRVVDSASTKDNSPKIDNTTNNAGPVVDQQVIWHQERKINAYTDDPYTHYSIASTPALLPARAVAQNTTIKNKATNATVDTTQNVTQPILSHQIDIARTPASTMKLVPSLIALDTLGADFTWYTRVYHTGLIIKDRLYGDLIIQGSGDPKMTHERLQALLLQVQKSGVRHINGDIIIDSAIFNKVNKDPATFDRSPLRSYNASPDGFLVNFNSVALRSRPLDNGQAELNYTPQLASYQLPPTIDMRSAPCSQARYSLAPIWQMDQLSLNAKLPNSCGEHVFYIAYPDAKDFASRVVAAKWQQLGNTLTGKVVAQEQPYSIYKNNSGLNNSYKNNDYKNSLAATNLSTKPSGLKSLAITPLPIVSYPSLPLKQQIYDINHFSNNVLTEQVALSIDAYKIENGAKNLTSKKSASNQAQSQAQHKKMSATSLYEFGAPKMTDYPQALQTINQWWQTHLTTAPPHLTNGSGLCRDCTISAANLNELLTYAYYQPSFDAYVNSLGVAGVSGTIVYHSERLPDSAAIGRAWIKTGTLNNVTAMAGYVKGQSGQDYSVVGLINTQQALNPYTARPVLDSLLDWTAQQ
ncbi:D-alanyl-D-alanine carboxypeptidase/D-alanyl-D-alanine-endopeptidase [uncultured Psychrobacter sp.]|uniref:D-alanyl-D-alanine carboxypeptidase/D-alanyl-D-alanine-endopeptidase n=1 Tax=uncultured Psychrobacter sp. TaxID=259303 RepID=UPI003457D3EB